MTKTKKPNKIIYQDEKEVHLELNKGNALIIDVEDYDRIKDYRWRFEEGRVINESSEVYTHIAGVIVDVPEGMAVCKLNGNRCDYRKSNLKVCECKDVHLYVNTMPSTFTPRVPNNVTYLDAEIARIKVASGEEFTIDTPDLELVNKYRWKRSLSRGTIYFRTTSAPYKKKAAYLHRLILNAPEGVLVDHINHDTTDNRRCNLRLCTKSENAMNTLKLHGVYRSNYKGVHKSGVTTWKAGITVNGETIHLGTFKDEKSAALAYNEAAKKYHKEFACINNIDD